MERRRVKKRVIVLGAAGLLLGATAFGWIQHATKHGGKAATVAATVPINNSATGGTTVALQSVEPLAVQQPVTKVEQIATVVKQSSGREDPTAPIADNVEQPLAVAAAELPAPPARREAHSDRHHGSGMVVPPPPVAYGTPVYAPSYVPELVSAPSLPVREAVRLVGIVDNKAFFAVPWDVARANEIPTEFTLGQGQSCAGISLESIAEHSVTIRDGSHVLKKDLATIR